MATVTNPTAPPADVNQQFIRQQLQTTRRQVKLVEIFARVLLLIALSLSYLLAVAIADHWLLPLSALGRWVALGALLAFAALYTLRYLAPAILLRVNPLFAAQTIEQGSSGLKNSLINFVMLDDNRGGLHEAVFGAIRQRAVRDLHTVDVDATVDRGQLIRGGYLLIGVLVVAAGYIIFSPKSTMQSIGRVLAPWTSATAPSRVRISSVEPGDATVQFGDHVDVRVSVFGLRETDNVSLFYSTADRQTVDARVPLELSASGLFYEGRFPPHPNGAQQSVTYRIEAGDAKSRLYALDVVAAPTIVVDSVEFAYPAYTKLPPHKQQQPDIRALEGTRVTVRARANRPIKSASLELSGGEGGRDPAIVTMEYKDVEAWATMTMESARGTAPHFTQYRIRFLDENGDANRDPIAHGVEVIADMPPVVQITQPERRKVEVREDGKLDIIVRALDPDFGLAEVEFYAAAGGAQVMRSIRKHDAVRGQVSEQFTFQPRKLGLKSGDQVLYRATARDNRVAPTGSPEANEEATEDYYIVVTDPIRPAESEPGQGADNRQGGEGDAGQQPQDPDASGGADDPMDGGGKDGPQGQPPNDRPMTPDTNSNSQNKPENPDKGDSGDAGDMKTTDPGAGNEDSGNEDSDNKDPEQGKDENSQGAGDQGEKKPMDGGSGGSGGSPMPGENGGESGKGAPMSGGSAQSQSPSAGSDAQSTSQGGAGQNTKPSDTAGGPQVNKPGSGDPSAPGQAAPQDGSPGQGGGGESTSDGQTGEAQRDEPLHPGEAIEQIQDHAKKQPQGGGGSGQGQSADSQRPQGAEGARQDPGGQPGATEAGRKPQGGSSQQAGQADSQNAPMDGDGGGDAKEPGAGGRKPRLLDNKQAAGDQQQGDGNEGGNPQGGAQQAEQRAPGEKSPDRQQGAGRGDNGQTGSGRSEQNKDGSAQAIEDNKQSKKQRQADNAGAQPNNDPQSPSMSKKQSQAQGDSGGDRSGSGQKGGGQGGPQPGNDKAGQQSSADEGAGAANESGSGETSDSGGDKQRSQDATGVQGDEKGPGSRSQVGSEQQGGGPPRADQQSPREQNSKSNKTGQKQTGGGGRPSGGGGLEPDGEGGSPSQPIRDVADGDPANLEYARKATDLALDYLKHNPADQELLDKLGWTPEEAQQFVNRWEKLKSSARESDVGKRQLDENLRSLGLRPGVSQTRRQATRNDQSRGLRQDGGVRGIPAEYLEQFNAARRGMARGSKRPTQQKPAE
jgi:hypothetical protein